MVVHVAAEAAQTGARPRYLEPSKVILALFDLEVVLAQLLKFAPLTTERRLLVAAADGATSPEQLAHGSELQMTALIVLLCVGARECQVLLPGL